MYYARMYRDKRIVVVMPAYKAALTLRDTYDGVMAQEIVDRVIVVDDASHDDTAKVARSLKYGFGCLLTAAEYRLAKLHLIKSRRFAR
jgi:hypothetical protein